MKTEYQIQMEIVQWFRNEYQRKGLGLIFSVPNEASYQNRNFKSTGAMNGVSDLIVIMRNEIIFAEVKNELNVQSNAQKEFESSIISLGYKYALIRSLNEFKALIITNEF